MNIIAIIKSHRVLLTPIVSCLFFMSLSFVVEGQTTFEIDGKAIIRDMPMSDTSSSIVVKLSDGTLAIRSAASLQSLSTSIDTITTFDPNLPDGTLSLIIHFTDGSADTLASVLQKGTTGSPGPQGLAGVGIAQTLSLDADKLILSDGGGSVLVDTSNLNELQTITREGLLVTLSDGGSYVDSVLTESVVDAMVSNNNYLTTFTEVDGDVTNELQTITREGLLVTLSDGGSYEDSVLTESVVDAMVANNNYLTQELDDNPTNEIQDIDLFTLSNDELSISLTSDADEYKVDLSRYLDDTDTQLTKEQVQDSVGALVSDISEDLIQVIYNDEDDRLDFIIEDDLSLFDNSVSQFLQSEEDGSSSNELISSMSLTGDTLSIVEGENTEIVVSLKDIKGGTRQATDENDYNIRSHNEGALTGDARGEYSVDLQTLRTEVDQVAGSIGSVISGGISNKIAATGSGSAIGGGQWNTINASNAVIPGGSNLIANSYGETVIGYANEPSDSADPQQKIATDRIFTIGNGANSANRSNAMVVLKNGNTGLGTSVPESTLHVDGAFRYIDGHQAEGKVLVSDKNGVASWQSLSITIGGASDRNQGLVKAGQSIDSNYADVRDQLSQQKEVNKKLQAQLVDQQKQIDLLKTLIMKMDTAHIE